MNSFSIIPAKKLTGQFLDLRHTVSRVLNAIYGISANSGIVITFVSCDHGEGVTNIAANFAAAIARDTRQRVLLVDGDLRTPSLQTLFSNNENQLKSNQPIAAHIKDGAILWNVRKINYNLDVLLVQETQTDPTWVYESSWFKYHLNSIRTRYDYIIIDSPPLKASSGGLILSTVADGTILVVEASRVRREVIQQYINTLIFHGAKFVGVIMNKRKYPIPRFIYKLFFG